MTNAHTSDRETKQGLSQKQSRRRWAWGRSRQTTPIRERTSWRRAILQVEGEGGQQTQQNTCLHVCLPRWLRFPRQGVTAPLLAMGRGVGVSCPTTPARRWQLGTEGYPEVLEPDKRGPSSMYPLPGLGQSRKTSCRRCYGRWDWAVGGTSPQGRRRSSGA